MEQLLGHFPTNNYTWSSKLDCEMETLNCSGVGRCVRGPAYTKSDPNNIYFQCQCFGFYDTKEWCTSSYYLFWQGEDTPFVIFGIIYHVIFLFLFVGEIYQHIRHKTWKEPTRRFFLPQCILLLTVQFLRIFYYAQWARNTASSDYRLTRNNQEGIVYLVGFTFVFTFFALSFTNLLWMTLAASILNLGSKDGGKSLRIPTLLLGFLVFAVFIVFLFIISFQSRFTYVQRENVFGLTVAIVYLVQSMILAVISIFLYKQFKLTPKGRANQYKNYFIWVQFLTILIEVAVFATYVTVFFFYFLSVFSLSFLFFLFFLSFLCLFLKKMSFLFLFFSPFFFQFLFASFFLLFFFSFFFLRLVDLETLGHISILFML